MTITQLRERLQQAESSGKGEVIILVNTKCIRPGLYEIRGIGWDHESATMPEFYTVALSETPI